MSRSTWENLRREAVRSLKTENRNPGIFTPRVSSWVMWLSGVCWGRQHDHATDEIGKHCLRMDKTG